MLLEEARHKDAKRALRSVLTSFGHARRKINSEIEKWLLQIAVNNELSMNEARKLLKADELDDFHMDLAEYIRKARDNDDDKWAKQLVNASAKVHISKWEAMNLAIEEYLREAFGDEDKIVNTLLESTARETYCQTAYEVENGLGMGKALNVPAVDAIISNPWATDERIFSDRIWAHMREMKADLRDQILQQTLTGAAPDDAIQTLEQYVKDKTESAGKRAETLVMTENAAISSAAQQKCYGDLGIDEYEIVATLDSKTCSRCGAKDLMHYPIKMYAPGSTANPFHARCRCTTAPYIEGDDVAERMMRNPETGKAEYIPNMTYEEWKEKYLKADDTLE